MVKLVALVVLLLWQFASTNQQIQQHQGPRGYRVPQGDKGIHGPPPDREELMAMIKVLTDRVDQISFQLNQTANKLDNLYLDVHPPTTTSSLPESCKTSEVEGRQFLRSGDEVYCEGGWQVFQNRFDGSISFNRDWTEYKKGFGDLSTEFWMGLDKLHRITAASTRCRLRVDLWDFSDGHAYAEYSNFSVGDEERFYRLTIGGYSGTAGDSMNSRLYDRWYDLNGMKFTTRDRDNDRYHDNCAVVRGGGGWWYKSCSGSLLNSVWSRTSAGPSTMSWYSWKDKHGGIKASKMKVKCD